MGQEDSPSDILTPTQVLTVSLGLGRDALSSRAVFLMPWVTLLRLSPAVCSPEGKVLWYSSLWPHPRHGTRAAPRPSHSTRTLCSGRLQGLHLWPHTSPGCLGGTSTPHGHPPLPKAPLLLSPENDTATHQRHLSDPTDCGVQPSPPPRRF